MYSYLDDLQQALGGPKRVFAWGKKRGKVTVPAPVEAPDPHGD